MTNGTAIAEIAGRDSVAAAVAAVRARGFTTVLPTIALTGTETGDAEAPVRAAEALERLLGDSCEVLEPIYLTDPDLWSAVNARHSAVFHRRWGLCSACLACHLYLHMLRVPVAWELGGPPVVAGERESHDGRLKLSQTHASIDASIRVLAHAGVELIEPLRHASGSEVRALVGEEWAEDAGQMGCLLAGNYRDLDGSVRIDEQAYGRFIAEYFEPVGLAIVDAWRAQRDGGVAPDWESLVAGVLEGGER